MALTITEQVRGHLGATKAVVVDVTFDSSYPDGGELFTPADVGLSQFIAVFCAPASNGTTQAVACWYDETNQKIMAFETGDTVSTPLDEVGAAESLANYVTHVLCIGH